MDRETGFFRTQWTYFKKGKNEINFMMNVYQTIILLFSMSFLGNLPLITLIFLTLSFVVGFIVVANRLGKYAAKKTDPAGFYVSPYFQDVTHYRIHLLKALMITTDDPEARDHLATAIEIKERWIRADGERI